MSVEHLNLSFDVNARAVPRHQLTHSRTWFSLSGEHEVRCLCLLFYWWSGIICSRSVDQKSKVDHACIHQVPFQSLCYSKASFSLQIDAITKHYREHLHRKPATSNTNNSLRTIWKWQSPRYFQLKPAMAWTTDVFFWCPFLMSVPRFPVAALQAQIR